MTSVFEHELRNYLHSFTTWLFCACLLAFVGVGALLYNIQASVANFEYVLEFIVLVLVITMPILTMRSMAEEKKQKTDQLLYSLPLKSWEIITGKYLALLVIFLIPICIICVYPLMFAKFGDVYLPTSYGSIAAFFMLGASLTAIGVFISSVTDNQGLAAGITIPLLLFNYFSVQLADYVSQSALGSIIAILVLLLVAALIITFMTRRESYGIAAMLGGAAVLAVVYFAKKTALEGLLPLVMRKLSMFERFYDFVDGVFDITHLVFYATVIFFFLFLSVQSFDKRRYN